MREEEERSQSSLLPSTSLKSGTAHRISPVRTSSKVDGKNVEGGGTSPDPLVHRLQLLLMRGEDLTHDRSRRTRLRLRRVVRWDAVLSLRMRRGGNVSCRLGVTLRTVSKGR